MYIHVSIVTRLVYMHLLLHTYGISLRLTGTPGPQEKEVSCHWIMILTCRMSAHAHFIHRNDESTAGADASVEMPKLYIT